MPTTRHLTPALLAALAFAPLAAAQSAAATQPEPAATSTPAASTEHAPAPTITDPADPKWTVSIEPIVWYVGPSGDLKLPAGAAVTPSDSVDINDLNIDSPRLSPAGTFRIASERWSFRFFGSNYAIDHTQTVSESFQLGDISFAPGDQAHTELSYGIYEITAAYRFFEYDWAKESAHPETADQVLLTLSAYGGALMQDVDVSVQSVGASGPGSDYSNLFVQPIIGLDLTLELADQFAIDLRLSGGGLPLDDESSASFDIAVAFTWQATENVGVQIGWRQLAFWLSDGEDQDEFEFNGRLAGLFAGCTIRF